MLRVREDRSLEAQQQLSIPDLALPTALQVVPSPSVICPLAGSCLHAESVSTIMVSFGDILIVYCKFLHKGTAHVQDEHIRC